MLVRLILGDKPLKESFSSIVLVVPGGIFIGRAQTIEECRGLERRHGAVRMGVLIVQMVLKMRGIASVLLGWLVVKSCLDVFVHRLERERELIFVIE